MATPAPSPLKPWRFAFHTSPAVEIITAGRTPDEAEGFARALLLHRDGVAARVGVTSQRLTTWGVQAQCDAVNAVRRVMRSSPATADALSGAHVALLNTWKA